MKVAKFGGTSLADANQAKKVIAIISSDPKRHYVVVSAPGKRNTGDQKITDLLYEWQRQRELRLSSNEIKQIIYDRYAEIVGGLGINFDLTGELNKISQKIDEGASADYAASRGEYLCGKIMARALDFEFVDPATCIYFDVQGHYRQDDERLRSILLGRKTVIPGFYGSLPDNSIKTFSRGGSDISGAIIARAVGASLYENWTDVSGLLAADPRVTENPRQIHTLTYRELRELTYMGANVFHEEAMFPVQEAGIATNIRNTNDPSNCGTYIIGEKCQKECTNDIIGVAGRKNFTMITVEKAMMNQQVGFARRILSVLEANSISFEHLPGGIDTLSIVIDDKQLNGKLEKVIREINDECSPDAIEVLPNMAMIAAVGRAMVQNTRFSAKIFTAIADRNINIRMISQGASKISIIIGVENNDYNNVINAIYQAFI